MKLNDQFDFNDPEDFERFASAIIGEAHGKIVYSREVHNSLLGVQGKAEEGKFMILGEMGGEGFGGEDEAKGEQRQGGFTIGGDVGFYEWNFESIMIPKDTQQQ